jgi:hypothetical protein
LGFKIDILKIKEKQIKKGFWKNLWEAIEYENRGNKEKIFIN